MDVEDGLSFGAQLEVARRQQELSQPSSSSGRSTATLESPLLLSLEQGLNQTNKKSDPVSHLIVHTQTITVSNWRENWMINL